MENSYELAKRCEHDCREAVNLGEEGKDFGKIFEMNMGAVHIKSAHIYLITALLQCNATAQVLMLQLIVLRNATNLPPALISLFRSVPLTAI